mmetsp:Transcript_11031/g.20033  ORF Transcript_11031/g.20033 Transcript_11031/m.20033 type:complete len:176 (-) Transcript_11031:56-583(-)|eukprot:CAMPEP_0175063276 /NCGR_PEP_ID=MMETSP0052_2-20121109/14658_1 /TAXON_ID=51329 ORGANISM="Polytomella parva, Strain SAG 63-3" /NCGR_SAMPLE_ID=MMETSP0052_2 /ASSEMBLY_ACC=CAM_ASM_000194 /LENGTH=175 /DNA_ID=CAMNT_0016329439 /DNA_START=82 /DNA_END=609 /DNA_ORIENTATION=-
MTWSESVHANRLVGTIHAAREVNAELRNMKPEDAKKCDKQEAQAKRLIQASHISALFIVASATCLLFGDKILKRVGIDDVRDVPVFGALANFLPSKNRKNEHVVKENLKPELANKMNGTASKMTSTPITSTSPAVALANDSVNQNQLPTCATQKAAAPETVSGSNNKKKKNKKKK